jgi:hypothetical protein
MLLAEARRKRLAETVTAIAVIGVRVPYSKSSFITSVKWKLVSSYSRRLTVKWYRSVFSLAPGAGSHMTPVFFGQ